MDSSDPAEWEFDADSFNIYRHDYLAYTGRL